MSAATASRVADEVRIPTYGPTHPGIPGVATPPADCNPFPILANWLSPFSAPAADLVLRAYPPLAGVTAPELNRCLDVARHYFTLLAEQQQMGELSAGDRETVRVQVARLRTAATHTARRSAPRGAKARDTERRMRTYERHAGLRRRRAG